MPQIVKLQKEAAELLGVTPTALRQWAKLPGFPDCSNGYDVEAIQRWRQEQDRKGSDTSHTLTKLKLGIQAQELRIKKVRADQAEREEQLAQGNILPRDEYELFAREVITIARDRLQAIPQTLCRLVPKEFHSAILTEGKDHIRRILTELARALEDGPSEDE